ncbi:MAG: flagellar filament capping protein FliD [Terracidiphilus sp.]
MGTVGLNFGAATSGTGFNVSSTVAEIVGNLQNVEKPWNSQLTTLQSQDKAISSLGTLFSSLSNDMSSLTDADGILAEKTGSSSDTNVLTLTSADSSAGAGTHTVEVGNLATTSSGYLAQIANADDPLSGSITVQAGNGTQLTITLDSSNNTLAGLAATINSADIGINASVLTDSSGSMLSLVSATSGAAGDITVNSSTNTLVATDTAVLSYTAATNGESGTLTALANTTDTLNGSLSIKVGTGTAQTIVVGAEPSGGPALNTIYTGSASGWNTLTGLETAINTASLGVTASIVTSSSGAQSLSLRSDPSADLTVNSRINDVTGTTPLTYSSPVSGADAKITVDGVNLTSASNSVANLIPGVTFQLLAPSANGEQVQVVIGNDNNDVESTVNQFVNDYNSLMSAMNTQEGDDSSGIAEPLFGSPTLTLLQQQLLSGLNSASPNGALTPISANANTTLAGSISIQVGSGTAQSVSIASGSTISEMANAINLAKVGVTAGVVTSNRESCLTLTSGTEGSRGALTVNSSIVATSDTPLTYMGSDASVTQNSSGALAEIPNENDALSGSISIQLGDGATQTIIVPPNSATSPSDNLSGLADAINAANIGVTASVVQNGNGSWSLSLGSETAGSAGNLTVTSNVVDATNTSNATLSYTNSSDVNSLTSLGISVNNDGSISLNTASLDSMLNSDYSGVVGFFQNANSWGMSFSNMLTNAGTSSPTGILALASKSDSNIESTLNADISKENSLISAQQISLTAELNSANEIMQELPSQLEGVNELYSAITGYNQNTGG